jgi:hypothetical protein
MCCSTPAVLRSETAVVDKIGIEVATTHRTAKQEISIKLWTQWKFR